jgi:hypothetical protein
MVLTVYCIVRQTLRLSLLLEVDCGQFCVIFDDCGYPQLHIFLEV